MIEYILYDADGVVIAKREKYFSDRLIDDFSVPAEASMDFVKNSLLPSMVGKADMRQAMSEFLIRWEIKKSVDEMFEHWWSAESTINNDVLDVVDLVRGMGKRSYLATDQEKYRANYIVKELGLGKHFDGTFMSCDLGCQKHDPEFWTQVFKTLKVDDPSRVLFWDDDQKNVDTFVQAGGTGRFFDDVKAFREETLKLIAV